MRQDEAMKIVDDGIARVEKKIEGFKAEIESVSAPVASDARELADALEKATWDALSKLDCGLVLDELSPEQRATVYKRREAEVAAWLPIINAAFAERERKAREEERVACAERASGWFCAEMGYPEKLGEAWLREMRIRQINELRAAIKEAGK